jgi:hypothetical protein
MVVPLDYSRAGLYVSLPRANQVLSVWRFGAILLAGLALASGALAQYPGKVAKTDKSAPILRSVAVLEWTGDPGKPSASRLVPVAVYDGEQLNDGTIYLTRPEPLALAGGVEYELQTAGKAMGLFDVFDAIDVNGGWQGFGAWKPLTAAETAKAQSAFNTSTLYGGGSSEDDDKPVLKRKHPQGTDSDAGAASGGSSSADKTTASTGSDDADRPTLKRKSGDDSGQNSGSASGSGSSGSTASVDPDRPTLHRSHRSAAADVAQASNAAPDPDRPRLQHGKPASSRDTESPRLAGYPPSMQQAVAVSDEGNRTEHPWKYTWANPDDEAKMKETLEGMARTALGLDAPAAPAKPVRKTAASLKAKKTPLVPPAPAELVDEQFRVFELAYGATATMVLTASTPKPPVVDEPMADEPPPPAIKRGKPTASAPVAKTAAPPKLTPPAPQKFVTLVAQPDLYGGVMVLSKSVTDAAHLDETPRMRLIDAVDAMGDNRGELLFELRGKTQRQFALFRVLRGSAEQLFATVAIP